MLSRIALLLPILLIFTACRKHDAFTYSYQKTAFSKEGMVVSGHPLATEAGIDILNRGGNAVDAAIAVYVTLAVVYPRAGNIGGGGFLIYRNAAGSAFALDFREKAPAASHRDMYLDSNMHVIAGLSREGHLASGVPGSVAGLVEAHHKFGTLTWSDLFERAIQLSRNGHPITSFEANRLNAYRDLFKEINGSDIPFVSDSIWKEGDILVQTDLAQTLERIAQHQGSGFYDGKTADFILNTMQEGNGLIDAEDLKSYTAVWRDPVIMQYAQYRVICMPPPSSGGIALAQLLSIMKRYSINDWGHHDLRTIHLMTEAERRVYADRAKYLGDEDFYTVPKDTLLDMDYLLNRMQNFSMDTATKSDVLQSEKFALTKDKFETTHFTVVDADGNAVAITTTLNDNYGSKVYVKGAGFFLNNEMDDFSVKPGAPNIYGLIGGEANAIEPHKRMLSSMTPTIVEKDDEFFMTIGTPGGSTIITSVFQAFLNVAEFGMTATESVASCRFHHQWLPDEIVYEKGCFSDSLKAQLSSMGHTLREVDQIGLVEMIVRLPDGTLEGASDPRESGHALGVESKSKSKSKSK